MNDTPSGDGIKFPEQTPENIRKIFEGTPTAAEFIERLNTLAPEEQERAAQLLVDRACKLDVATRKLERSVRRRREAAVIAFAEAVIGADDADAIAALLEKRTHSRELPDGGSNELLRRALTGVVLTAGSNRAPLRRLQADE